MPKSEPATGTQAQEDRFLIHFLPGTAQWVRAARSAVSALNSPSKSGLVRAVLIRGESGAGKTYMARVIAGHKRWLEITGTTQDLGPEAGLTHYTDRLAEINIPGVPDQLVESELFGYRKGAFTGATTDHPGYFGQGLNDILLDEIGDASKALQAKLLGVLQTRRFLPLGATKDDEAELSARVLLATNRDLAELAKNGAFRRDLLWRISVFSVEVPPLRRQRENIPDIIARLQDELDSQMGYTAADDLPRPRRLPSCDVEWAADYSWPGNIRHLSHALARWRFYDGGLAFPKAAKSLESEVEAASREEGAVEEYVEHRLRAIERGAESPVTTPNDIVKDVSDAARRAIVRWAGSVKGSRDILGRVFTTGSTKSVQNKISRWRSDA